MSSSIPRSPSERRCGAFCLSVGTRGCPGPRTQKAEVSWQIGFKSKHIARAEMTVVQRIVGTKLVQGLGGVGQLASKGECPAPTFQEFLMKATAVRG